MLSYKSKLATFDSRKSKIYIQNIQTIKCQKLVISQKAKSTNFKNYLTRKDQTQIFL